MPPPQKIFSILGLKMATFTAFWALATRRGGPWPLPAPLDPPVDAESGDRGGQCPGAREEQEQGSVLQEKSLLIV